jgi:hypothetical protein
MKNFTINQKEKDAILEMHIKATQRLYLTEQQNKVQGTLKTAERTPMIQSYNDLLKKIEDENQTFVIGNTDGVVSVGGNSNQLRGKFFKSTDSINFDGKGFLLVYPKGVVDQQFSIQPRGGKLFLFVGA